MAEDLNHYISRVVPVEHHRATMTSYNALCKLGFAQSSGFCQWLTLKLQDGTVVIADCFFEFIEGSKHNLAEPDNPRVRLLWQNRSEADAEIARDLLVRCAAAGVTAYFPFMRE